MPIGTLVQRELILENEEREIGEKGKFGGKWRTWRMKRLGQWRDGRELRDWGYGKDIVEL